MLAYELCHELGFNACTFALEPGSRHGELSPLSVIIIHRGESSPCLEPGSNATAHVLNPIAHDICS